MDTNNSLLPKEAVALVQHIELNRAGWWEKTVNRLVLAAVWLSDDPPDSDAIQQSLKKNFKLVLGNPQLAAALEKLENRKMLLSLPSGAYRIPDSQRSVFEGEIAESEKVEAEAKTEFCRIVVETCKGLNPDEVWIAFENDFLGPLIKQVGANAYRLVAGEKMTIEKSYIDHFLKTFPTDHHSDLRTLVTTYIDPKKQQACAYISRMLHARFCVDASGLPGPVLAKLNASVGKQIRFQMLVDTNFLFSLLELHENPSNVAAQELRDLIRQLNGNPIIDLVITAETIEEAKSSIRATKARLSGFPVGSNFNKVALESGFSGMAMRFLTERSRKNGKLTAEDWFDPYLNDFVPIARGRGVELYNAKLDEYRQRQDVVDDVLAVLKAEEKRPPGRQKNYPQVVHDMVLWHFANDKRPAYIESPIDANFWILTQDFGLLGFDLHKQKKAKSKIPLCLHPTSLIQLLQFWVPRTKEFEEAMLGSLRLPFLFQGLDAEGEDTSLKILKGIGRYEGSADLSQETITHVMLNDGLRARMQGEHSSDVEIEMIRDALVEELKIRADAEEAKAKHLQNTIGEREVQLATLAEQKLAIEAEKAKSIREKEESEAVANRALAARDNEIGSLQTRLQTLESIEQDRVKKEEARIAKRNAFLKYIGCLVVVICITIAVVLQSQKIFPWYSKILGQIPTKGVAGLLSFVFGHLILELSVGRNPVTSRLWPYRHVKNFRRSLWTIVCVGFFGGVFGNIYANRIQKSMDEEKELAVPVNKMDPLKKDTPK
jgi:hypothetical protein